MGEKKTEMVLVRSIKPNDSDEETLKWSAGMGAHKGLEAALVKSKESDEEERVREMGGALKVQGAMYSS